MYFLHWYHQKPLGMARALLASSWIRRLVTAGDVHKRRGDLREVALHFGSQPPPHKSTFTRPFTIARSFINHLLILPLDHCSHVIHVSNGQTPCRVPKQASLPSLAFAAFTALPTSNISLDGSYLRSVFRCRSRSKLGDCHSTNNPVKDVKADQESDCRRATK